MILLIYVKKYLTIRNVYVTIILSFKDRKAGNRYEKS